MAPRKSATANPPPTASAVSAGDGEFPKMVYGPNGQQKIVADADAQERLGAKWKEEPSGE